MFFLVFLSDDNYGNLLIRKWVFGMQMHRQKVQVKFVMLSYSTSKLAPVLEGVPTKDQLKTKTKTR